MRRLILALILASIAGTHLLGQAAHSPAKSPHGPKGSALPRTPDAHPDMQGTWTHGTLTPLERPVALGNKAFYSEAEIATLEAQAAERRKNGGRGRGGSGDVGGDNEAFVDEGYRYLANRQTSLVVDPPDGRIPFKPSVEAKREFNLNSRDDYESMSTWDRCITRSPTLMLPAGYDNGIEIVQTRGRVLVHSEMVHEARIIPTDGGLHSEGPIRSWTGEPRGHWEGDTLVVDSTHFRAGWVSTHAGSGRLRGTPNTEALHLVERFTMIDPKTIAYELTIEDPEIYTQPWKVSLLLNRDDGYQVYEYACHEGNQAIELVLRGARTEEKAAADDKAGATASPLR